MKTKALKTHASKTELTPPSLVTTTSVGEKSLNDLTEDRIRQRSRKIEVATETKNNHPREGMKSVEDTRLLNVL